MDEKKPSHATVPLSKLFTLCTYLMGALICARISKRRRTAALRSTGGKERSPLGGGCRKLLENTSLRAHVCLCLSGFGVRARPCTDKNRWVNTNLCM
jgi:hypothetical protein